ncbi:MAG: DUF4900 domain-containing protein [Candidatus Omnitrophota bacterium]
MVKKYSDRRGFLLLVASIVMIIVATLVGVFFATVVSEKHSVDVERFAFQASGLADAGANKAWAEFKYNFESRLIPAFENIALSVQASKLGSYYNGSIVSSLLLFSDYANQSGTYRITDADDRTRTKDTCINCVGIYTVNTSLSDEMDSAVPGYILSEVVIQPAQNKTVDAADGTYTFSNYTYSIESRVHIDSPAQPVDKAVVLGPDRFNVNAHFDNFAKYALFTFNHKTPSGTTVWFTSDTNFYGPVHTNDKFSFANNPSAHFTDVVSQPTSDRMPCTEPCTNSTARFYNGGNSILMDSDHNAARDVPAFDAGFIRNAKPVTMSTTLKQADMKSQALGGAAAPSVTTPSVVIPYNTTTNALTGGIYINSNPSYTKTADNPSLVMSVDPANNAVYNITQYYSHAAHVTQVTVNSTSNTTTVIRDGVTNTYNGIPDGKTHEGTLIYSNDQIDYFNGTVQEDTQLTVAGEKNIIINGNVTYQGYSTTPSLNAEGYDNLLGLVSWYGQVIINEDAPPNVTISGIIMAPNNDTSLGPLGTFTVDGYNEGSSRGAATLLGGVITAYYGAFGTFSPGGSRTGYGRNFVYDGRVLNGQSPPYFPYMDKYTIDPPPGLSVKKVWREKEGSDE